MPIAPMRPSNTRSRSMTPARKRWNPLARKLHSTIAKKLSRMNDWKSWSDAILSATSGDLEALMHVRDDGQSDLSLLMPRLVILLHQEKTPGHFQRPITARFVSFLTARILPPSDHLDTFRLALFEQLNIAMPHLGNFLFGRSLDYQKRHELGCLPPQDLLYHLVSSQTQTLLPIEHRLIDALCREPTQQPYLLLILTLADVVLNTQKAAEILDVVRSSGALAPSSTTMGQLQRSNLHNFRMTCLLDCLNHQRMEPDTRVDIALHALMDPLFDLGQAFTTYPDGLLKPHQDGTSPLAKLLCHDRTGCNLRVYARTVQRAYHQLGVSVFDMTIGSRDAATNPHPQNTLLWHLKQRAKNESFWSTDNEEQPFQALYQWALGRQAEHQAEQLHTSWEAATPTLPSTPPPRRRL